MDCLWIFNYYSDLTKVSVYIHVYCIVSDKPYKFEYDIIQHCMDTDAMISVIRQMAEKYSLYQNRVEMLGSYRSFTGHTCLSKVKKLHF